jgi:DNA topoisomerase-1
MAKSLVIVESPTKAKTIGKYLGDQFVVKASLGHIKDLPSKDLGVDVDHDFEPTYEVIEGKKDLISELKQAAKGVDNVYLAADPDREGEAICYHLQEELQGATKPGTGKKKKNPEGAKVFRVMFNEITKSAIQKAFENPLQVNVHLVEAQQARRVLDRLVGYKISPLLWDKVRRGASAGRVQSVALRLIVEREREIQAFQRKEYWTVDVSLAAANPPILQAHFTKRNDESIEIPNSDAADALLAQIEGAPYKVHSVGTREKRRNPVAPFITSTLQQESARKLRFSVKRTMILAQRLYEGVELGTEGAVGLITYMRTDSTRVSNDAVEEVRGLISKRFGKAFVPDKPNVYKGKKDAQDAHEAIRPASVLRTPEDIAPYLGEDELKLYRLIWMRFVASQMVPALFDQTTIDVAAPGKDGATYFFRATGSVPKFKGFLEVYEEGKDQSDDDDEELKSTLPAVTQGEPLRLESIIPEQHFTEPPPRFNEATLVKELEADGVGRPSTYAATLSTIQERGYVVKNTGRFYPTDLGTVVTDLLLESFENLFNITYTAQMEEQLDNIEEGKIDWRVAMADFYGPFKKDLDEAERTMTNIKRMEKPTEFLCDKCGKPMVIKWGKHGWFMACSGYPECKNTREVENPELTKEGEEEICDNCQRPMVLKKGRFGQFYACSGFPDCQTTKQLGGAQQKKPVPLEELCPQCGHNLELKYGRFGEFTACSNHPKCKFIKQKTIGVPCPNCSEGEVAEKRSRAGKTFYGCHRYPECDFTAWGKPLNEKCPECGSPYMVEKWLKAGGFAQCPNKECKYKHPLEIEKPVEAVV